MAEQKLVDTSINTVEQPTDKSKVQEVAKPAATQEQTTKAISKAEIGEKEKVFNQAQLDEIVISRLGKERARLLKRLGIEDETQLDDVVKKAQSYQDLAKKVEQFETQKLNAQKLDVLGELKADKDFVDYLLSKIEFGENLETFKANANKYLEANPRFRTETYKKVDSQVSVSKGTGKPDLENMTTEQYLAWRAKNKL
jgi:hypothetical protein